MEHFGYMGKILEVDLTEESLRELPSPALGGRALAASLLLERLSGRERALSEENTVVITTAPLTLSGFPGTARFDIGALSPRDDRPAIANCGGSFGIALRRAGYDALVLQGRCKEPRRLEISGERQLFCDASSLWGLGTEQCHAALSEGKRGCGILCIGPAGENRVNYASVSANGHSTGRAGFGAVLGWKNLKAIRVSGTARPPLYDGAKAAALCRRWGDALRAARRNDAENFCRACPLHCERQGRGDNPLLDDLGMDTIAAEKAAARFEGSGLSREEIFEAMARGRLEGDLPGSGAKENKDKAGKRRKGSFESVLRAFDLPDNAESEVFCRHFTEAVSVSGQCMFTLRALGKGEVPMLDMLRHVTGKTYTPEDFVALGAESRRLERELRERFD